MDKELLRVVIIAVGLLIIVGMLLWGYFRSQRPREERNLFKEFEEAIKARLAPKPHDSEHPHHYNKENRDKSFAQGAPHADSTHNKPSSDERSENSRYHHDTDNTETLDETEFDDLDPARPLIPRLIQLSIVSKAETGFNGAELDALFNMIGLEYGSMKVYERLDMNRMVDFAVASMINPGTFPDSDLENFHTPGVTFFMQPQELPDAILVFDDLIRTIDLLASELDGEVLDQDRKPLTESGLKAMRKSIKPA